MSSLLFVLYWERILNDDWWQIITASSGYPLFGITRFRAVTPTMTWVQVFGAVFSHISCMVGGDFFPLGSYSWSDNREGFFLRTRQELWPGILIHLPRWHNEALDLPLLYGCEGHGEFRMVCGQLSQLLARNKGQKMWLPGIVQYVVTPTEILLSPCKLF